MSVFLNLPGLWPTVEGMASAFRMVGILHCPPPMAAHQFLKHAMEKLKEYQIECESVNPLVHQLTPLGMKYK
jgi:hypothetical protein